MSKKILISDINEYSFRNITFKFIMEISGDYEVYLILPSTWEKSALVTQLISSLNIKEVFFENFTLKTVRDHVSFHNLIKKRLIEISPDVIMQSDYINIQNMYIFYIGRKFLKKVCCGFILNSMPSTMNTKSMLAQFRYPKFSFKQNYICELKLLFKIPLRMVYNFMQNILFPTVALRESSPFRTLPYMNIDIIPRKKLLDFIIYFQDTEKNYFLELFKNSTFGNEITYFKVSFPFKKLAYSENKKIVALPSLLCCRYSPEYEHDNLKIWAHVLQNFKNNFSKRPILLKFHPNLKPKITNELKDFFAKMVPDINFIDSDIAVHNLISVGDIIVSDFSTVLWEYQFYPSVTAISIPLNHYASAKDMALYENIYLVKDLNKLTPDKMSDFNSDKKNRQEKFEFSLSAALRQIQSKI